MLTELDKLYSRDLDRLKAEIKAFRIDSNIWKTKGEIQNSAGNLCLHLIANLNTYIGKNIGIYDYVRDRDAEFNLKDIPSPILLKQIDKT